ncbi:putative ATP/GTP-binding protein [Sphingopyxis macrogoltabida]|nr:putative ATP/GTP-binding protein [Sphingopyxis macrogoltabida]
MTRKMTAAEASQHIRALRLPKGRIANIDPVLALNKHLLANGLTASSERGRAAEMRRLSFPSFAIGEPYTSRAR